MVIPVYETIFTLKYPVNDFSAANTFLAEEDYLAEFKDEYIPEYAPEYNNVSFVNAISNISWELLDCQKGHVLVVTSRELLADELDVLSAYVYTEAKYGIGDRFSDENFAHMKDEGACESDKEYWWIIYNDGIERWNDLTDEEKARYDDQEDFAYNYAHNEYGWEPDITDDTYDLYAEFNYNKDDYVFHEFQGD